MWGKKMKKVLLFEIISMFICCGAYAYDNNVISKLAPYANYSVWKNKEVSFSETLQEFDIRSVDYTNKDLSKYSAENISFDSGTLFPLDTNKWPANFNPYQIMETHKNPGLNVRNLHAQGIDGTGMSMAIIDQPLSPHNEYNDNLVHYEEFLVYSGQPGSMHGPAVASIAVGKTVGVAPKAKLYYFAADLADGKFENDETKSRTSKYYAVALDKIIEINKTLPDNEKIVVVSVSAAPGWSRDPEIWEKALEKAKQAGIFVTTTQLEQEYGLRDNGVYRFVSQEPDNFESYRQTNWQSGRNIPIETQRNTLCFPMDHRTTAAPNGINDYVHYASGGWSWMKPFEAGVYVLAKQVKPDITPEEFFKVGLETGYYSETAKCILVNPVELIQKLKQ